MSNNTAALTLAQISDIEEFIKLNNEIKQLDKKKKALSENVKAYMAGAGMSTLTHNGATLSITESSRCTIKRKDEFIAELNAKGLGALLTIEVDVNKETLEAEINAGNLDPNFVNQYVTFTPVNTLRCS